MLAIGCVCKIPVIEEVDMGPSVYSGKFKGNIKIVRFLYHQKIINHWRGGADEKLKSEDVLAITYLLTSDIWNENEGRVPEDIQHFWRGGSWRTVTLTFSSRAGKSRASYSLNHLQHLNLHQFQNRHVNRDARVRACRNQWAAAHHASMAETATSVSLTDAPPHCPFNVLSSPTSGSERHQVTTVERPNMPTFSPLNLDGSSFHLHHNLNYCPQGNHLFAMSMTTATTVEGAPCSLWITMAAIGMKRTVSTVMSATARLKWDTWLPRTFALSILPLILQVNNNNHYQ